MTASNNTVIVTGASRGIGRQVAATLAEQGVTVVAVARDLALLQQVVADLPGRAHQAVALDVREQAAWEKLAGQLDRVDGIVAAAGIYGPIGRIDTVDIAGVRDAFDVNVFGSLLAVRAFLPHLETAAGSVVLFAGGGSEPLAGYDSYLASKAAVVRLAENLAAELADIGIRVNSVAPGFVATDIHQATLAAGPEVAGADFHARTLRALEDGGFPAAEVAELVAFLLSAESRLLSGRFFSARWDPWRDVEWRAAVAGRPDLLTMRRIDIELFDTARSSA